MVPQTLAIHLTADRRSRARCAVPERLKHGLDSKKPSPQDVTRRLRDWYGARWPRNSVNENQIEKLSGLLKSFDTVMLVTMDGDTCHARPMAVAQVDENADLWLFTGRDSAKVREIEADGRVQVLGLEGWTNCVVLEGHATVEEDRALIRDLWKPAFKVWFPGGAEDPNIALLHVRGERAEYWDNTGLNRLSYLFQSLKAAATGTTPEIKEGEQHGTVRL